ncbi:MAG: adenosylcobalamin-dependent ribonucleoside-diphosphate reductase, partial [Cenarchaeum sp. SB0667_bin_13]|nr:adenosylcobalamin-dependent ribonucleoside-diphosphate reductase [Cenarchaeum sp. SB0667_bin_13]
TMMNAGGRLGQLSACFVLDMRDDMEEIMKSTSDAALIFKSGGGVGINYSDLRYEGDTVASTFGVASGPVSFMNIINTVTEVVKQGGKRRGANMGILEVWHPDIEKFVSNKTKPGVLENFNVSVGIWEDFWDALLNSKDNKYILRSPRDKTPVKEINAQHLIDQIALSAWKSAEPGLIFLDQINKYNVIAKARMSPLRATNPCGEQSLYPNESCNLGSINLANLTYKTEDGSLEFDWEGYERIIRQTTRFLDNVVDVNQYPVEKINEASKESRRIGLGVMGVADLLYKLRIPYNSEEGYTLQSRLAEALSYFSMDESVELAKERGYFKLYPNTEYPEGRIPIAGYYESEDATYDWASLVKKITTHGIRNVLTTTVAPTGTLSMIADCSNGMEPNFALVYEKRVTIGKFTYVNKILRAALEEEGLYNDNILESIINNYGSLRGIDDIPQWMQDVFVTAMDIHWSDHLMAQAVWQRWISNAIAKTINMPYDVTVEDVKAAYLLAHEMGLKGITVYRDGSRQSQVMNMTDDDAKKVFEVAPSQLMLKFVSEHTTDSYAGQRVRDALVPKVYNRDTHAAPNVKLTEEMQCPTCKSSLIFAEGCSICVECGFSGCTSG